MRHTDEYTLCIPMAHFQTTISKTSYCMDDEHWKSIHSCSSSSLDAGLDKLENESLSLRWLKPRQKKRFKLQCRVFQETEVGLGELTAELTTNMFVHDNYYAVPYIIRRSENSFGKPLPT